MLNLEDQARVLLLIAACTSIEEVIEYTELIYSYVQELTSDEHEIDQMENFLKKISLNQINKLLIESTK